MPDPLHKDLFQALQLLTFGIELFFICTSGIAVTGTGPLENLFTIFRSPFVNVFIVCSKPKISASVLHDLTYV
jgi:hypothetical protein